MTNQIGSATTYEGGILATSKDQGEEGVQASPQELEVMKLIASGSKDYVIARRLGISVVTVRRRVVSFRNRVGATTRSEAVARAATLGLLDEHSVTEASDDASRSSPDDDEADR